MRILNQRKINNYNRTAFDTGTVIVSEYIPNIKSYFLEFVFDVGSRDERINGTAHFLEHAVFKHTKNRDTRQIANDFDILGDDYNAYTTHETTVFHTKALSDHLDNTFELLSDITLNSIFIDKELNKERKVIIEEIKYNEDDEDDCLENLFLQTILNNHPLSNVILGTVKTVKTIDSDELKSFYDNFYRYNNLTISCVGNIKHEELIEVAQKYLNIERNNIANNQFAVRTKPIFEKQKNVKIYKPIQQVHLSLGKPLQKVYNYPTPLYSILNIIFGADETSSRLYQTLREKNGLVYGIDTYINNFTDCAIWKIDTITDIKHYEKVLDLIYKEIDNMREKLPSNDEISRAKTRLKTSLIFDYENIENRANKLFIYENRFGGNYYSLDELIKQIDSITLEELEEEIIKYFNIDDWLNVSIFPNGK